MFLFGMSLNVPAFKVNISNGHSNSNLAHLFYLYWLPIMQQLLSCRMWFLFGIRIDVNSDFMPKRAINEYGEQNLSWNVYYYTTCIHLL